MHQIQFRLGLSPRPRWVSLQHSPDPLAEFKGPTSKEREGRAGEGEEGKGRDGTRWFLFTPPDVKSWIKACIPTCRCYGQFQCTVAYLFRSCKLSRFRSVSWINCVYRHDIFTVFSM